MELWSRENLPLLKATRPAELYVGSMSEGSKVDVKMLKRLGEGVGKTVTNLSIDQLQAATVDEFMEALSLFANSHGGTPLTKLTLSSTHFSLEHTM